MTPRLPARTAKDIIKVLEGAGSRKSGKAARTSFFVILTGAEPQCPLMRDMIWAGACCGR